MSCVNKAKTVMYIFGVTVAPQIVSIGAFLVVLATALAWETYGTFWLMLLGLAAITAYQFLLIGLSLLIKSYGMSVFSSERKDYVQYSASAPIKKTHYYIHKNNGGYTVAKREVTQSGCLLSLGLTAIINSATGIFKFIIESLRVCLFKERQASWDNCKQYFCRVKGAESLFQFMKMPAICVCIILVALGCLIPGKIILDKKHDINNLHFEITEKYNSEFSKFRVQTVFYGKLTNVGDGKVSSVKGVVVFKNRDGNILFSSKQKISAPFELRYDNLLKKNDTWNIALRAIGEPSDMGAIEVWDTELSDMEIYFDISEVWYENKVHKEYPDEEMILIHGID